MSQIARSAKNLEAPRPLKLRTTTGCYEVQSIEELITLTENVATQLANGINNQESMSVLLTNLRNHGPQLEALSKDTLDRSFVTFRNASQDERLNIMTRLHLLELIELRAKSWLNCDGVNSYYKHKAATNVEPDKSINEDLLLDTSPPSLLSIVTHSLGPGDIIRTSGKFTKPTKIPGKNYSKDEIVIKNADSGKVMGIKGRRVHMIEEMSETIISFQRVNPGVKERLVQITGPSEDKINYAKQLIEETIRRNASPTRLEGPGSCSSLASSASDENVARTNRNSIVNSNPNASTPSNTGTVKNRNISSSPGQTLLHSLSTNDATVGEYKYTVCIGAASIKITGDCFELVRVAKLVLDDYFSSNDFLASVDVGATLDNNVMMQSPQIGQLPSFGSPFIPSSSHQLNSSSSPFGDSGINLDLLLSQNTSIAETSNDAEINDEVFIVNSANNSDNHSSSSSSNVTAINGLARSRRSHFSRKDSTPEAGKENKDANSLRIVHEYERLLSYAKSPHSWSFPLNWKRITEKYPQLVKNKVLEDDKFRFDPDKHLELLSSGVYTNIIDSTEDIE